MSRIQNLREKRCRRQDPAIKNIQKFQGDRTKMIKEKAQEKEKKTDGEKGLQKGEKPHHAGRGRGITAYTPL